MSITKPIVVNAWADGAVAPVDIVEPSGAFIEAGWVMSATPPARQYFNWILNFCANAARYFSRRGVADYDPAETYLLDDITRGDDGVLYQSLQNANTANTPSISPAFWGAVNFYPLSAAEKLAGFTAGNLFNLNVAPGIIGRYGNNTTPGTTDMSAALANACEQSLQVGGAPAVINDLIAVNLSFAVPAGAHVTVASGSVNIATGQILQFGLSPTNVPGGTFSAARIKCFIGAGKVQFGVGGCSGVFPEWFGCRADSAPAIFNTDCTAGLAAAVLAACNGNTTLGGVVPLVHAGSGLYLTGAQAVPNGTVFLGTDRVQDGFVAKSGTVGPLFTDMGDAQKIVFQNLSFWGNSANCPGLTNLLKLGYGATPWGTEGRLFGLWFRDCACSAGGFFLDLLGNVAYVDTVAAYGTGLANQNLMRLNGVAMMCSNLVAAGGGKNCYSVYLGATSGWVRGLEIEAPGAAAGGAANVSTVAPLYNQNNVEISGALFSGADNFYLDHWVEFGASSTSWSISGVTYGFGSLKTCVVTKGNFKRSDGTYFGGNATGINAATVWSSAVTYVAGMLVTSGGLTWQATAGGVNHAPAVGSTFWQLCVIAAHGGEGNLYSETGGQWPQQFTLRIANVAGVLNHRISDSAGNLTNFSNLINNATDAFTPTPTGTDNVTAMAGGGKISSAQTGTFYFDTAAQAAAWSLAGSAMPVVSNVSGLDLVCIPQLQSLDINGVTITRLSFIFLQAVGSANFAIDTSNIPVNDLIEVTWMGFLSA